METSESAVWSQDPSNMREWAKLPVVWKCKRLIVKYRDHLLVLTTVLPQSIILRPPPCFLSCHLHFVK